MKRLMNANVIAGVVTLGIASFAFIETFTFRTPPITHGVPPASFFPRIITLPLGLCGIMLIISGIRTKAEALPAISWSVIATIGLIIVYIILMSHTDFFIVTPFLIASLAVIMGERDWKWLIGTVILFMLVAYFVFFQVLGVAFPTRII